MKRIRHWLQSLSISALILCAAATAHAVPLVADISSHRIEIHSAFTGTQLLLFGARNDPGDIVVLIRGPRQDFIVRKKERTAGIWVNQEEMTFDDIPQFYALASSRPMTAIEQFRLFDSLGIRPPEQTSGNPFRQAMLRILSEEGLHRRQTGQVEFMGETLFKASFNFPDNMPRGMYTAEAYLFSDGLLSGMQAIPLDVYKTGADAFLYDAAHNYRLIYGLAAIVIASAGGWFANWLFQRL